MKRILLISIVIFLFSLFSKAEAQTITTGPATGYISACAGMASVSPNIQQFTVSGSGLTAGITATAPTGFQVSLTAGSGYSNSVTLAETAGTVASTMVYVQSAAAAPAGNITGNVVLSSTGATSVNVAVTGTVNALPTVNAVANQTVLSGAATTAINFTGTGSIFNWVNNTPGIGLPASGTGNITSFTAVNTGTAPVVATVTATPISGGFAYITNASSGTISVINTATNTVISTVPVGTQVYGVSVSPDGSRVYVTTGSNTNIVSVINTTTNTVITTIPVGSLPFGITVSPDGSEVYVVNSNSNSVSVINTTTNMVVSTISLSGTGSEYVAVSPDGTRLYVTNNTSDNVSVINTATDAEILTIPVGSPVFGISVTPDGSHLYVVNEVANTVSVINTATNAVIATIGVGNSPSETSVSPDGSLAYVTNAGSNTVSVINTGTNAVVATIPVGAGPNGVSVSADGSEVYVANDIDGTVSVINTATNTVISTITVGTNPVSLGNFITGGVSCSGAPVTFTITVNPIPPTIITGIPTGNISACAGTASASPDIQQFTVFGSNLTAGITATAPTGFQVSLTAGSGYGNSVTLPQTGGTVANTVVYVESAASAPSGNMSGNVVLTSAGATGQNVAVTGTVNALPTVNAVANQTVLNGTATTAVNFTGTANTFNWVNDTPGIGLAAAGTGNIASFIAVNTGITPVTATITATPISSGFAYIPNLGDGTVSVINTTTNMVVNTITVGSGPNGASASPDGSRVYVINSGANTVSVISTVTNTIINTIGVGDSPSVVAISPDGSRVYVTNFYGNSVSVINTVTNAVVATISVGGNPTGVSVSPNGSLIYVASQGVNYVSVINTATNLVVSTIAVGSTPCGVAISPDGSRVYVANKFSNSVSVINTTTNNVISTIPVGGNPVGVSISPDGSMSYVTNSGSNNVSVINTLTNAVITTVPVGSAPYGVSISQDGSMSYVTNSGSNNVSVINTLTNAVIATVPVGSAPSPLGNFVTKGVSCSGTPVTFTITVNPSTPTITATGTLSPLTTTYGTASASTSFSVSGTNMTAGILVTPPPGFEVSTDNVTFSSTATIGTAGSIAPTPVYIRLTSTTPVGSYSGNIVLNSAGAPDVNVAMPSSTVNPAPLTITASSVNKAYGTTLTGGPGSTAFTVTGLQNSETIGSVTIAYGTGSAANAAAGTYAGSVTASSATGGTFSASNYTITYAPGDIIAGGPATIAITGGPSPLTTIYGTASVSTSFSVSGTNMAAGILVTPPPGFEVSTDNVTFSSILTVGASGTIASTTVYIRLISSTPVGNYSGNIVLSSTGTENVNVEMPISTVTPAPLTITADNKNKIVGTANPVLTLTYSGFVNNDGPSQLTAQPALSTTAVTTSPPGQYPITVSGAASPNYTFTYVAGILTIIPTIIIPNAFTPNGDGVNDTWDIKYLNLYPNCTVAIFNRWGQNLFSSIGYGVPWDGTYRGAALPTGTYYYIVNLKDGGKVLSGFVAIIK